MSKKKKKKSEVVEKLHNVAEIPEEICYCAMTGEYVPGKSRVLHIYTKLIEGKVFTREEIAEECHCSISSIQHDIDEIRMFLADRALETGVYQTVEYDTKKPKGYRLYPPMVETLSPAESLLVLKTLLDSRSLVKEELEPIITKLLSGCVPKEYRQQVTQLIGGERNAYIEPKHSRKIGEAVWELGNAIKKQLYVNIKYVKQSGKVVERKIMPVSLMVNEFYYYVIAFIKDSKLKNDEPYPIVYRIDRIQEYKVSRTNYKLPYKAFDEGEFRKRVQFMYNGPLKKIRLSCTDKALETVLDRLPTAEVMGGDKNRTIVRAEVFGGKGLEMWLQSQAPDVEVLEIK